MPKMDNLNAFFNPKTVAVVGASNEEDSVGNVIFKNFLKPEFNGNIFPINIKSDKVLGVKGYKSIKDV
ncbi:MAG: CoA-binding protein, partial [Candidatus Methanofastidiosia archaeon]